MNARASFIALYALASGACSDPSDPAAPTGTTSTPVVCQVTAPTHCNEPAPKYADVAPIFSTRCVACHSGAKGEPWPLTSYDHVADWAPEIRGQVLNCTMPPRDASSAITRDERERILLWIRCGLPE